MACAIGSRLGSSARPTAAAVLLGILLPSRRLPAQSAFIEGFSLHGGTHVTADDRLGLERFAR
jgi:hypothetical protein